VRQQTLGGSIRYDYTLKEILFIGLSAQINRQKTEYDFNKNLNQVYNNNTYSAEGNLTFFKNFQLNSNLDYYIYKSETTNFSRDFPIWNISVSRFLLKNKTGELKFSVMNALDQSLSVNQTASTNYLQQETTNNLGRYFMVSFTYSLNKQLNPMGGGPGGGGMRVMIRN
jgi:predicted porin